MSNLNPMVFYPGFPHIAEQIFEHLDNKSIKNCRKVSKSWQNCIDNRNILWNKIVNDEDGNKAFQLACKIGHSKIAGMLMNKSIELNIDLNAKVEKWNGMTAFHWACRNGKTGIIEMMISKAESLKLDLASRDNGGKTGYKLAQDLGRSEAVNLIKSKKPSLAF